MSPSPENGTRNDGASQDRRSRGEKTFRPSRHGFRFVNRFPLPLLDALGLPASYGLCGGMAQLARDFFLSGRSLPADEAPPAPGSLLHRAVLLRQLDTLGGAPFFPNVVTFARWTAATDRQLAVWTRAQLRAARRHLARGEPVLLGLIYVRRLARLWENHQVLAYDATEEDAASTLRVYDPNYPGRDDVVLRFEGRDVSWAGVQYAGGRTTRPVRGLFVNPVPPQPPPF